MKQHTYRIRTEWTGNRGTGTSSYREYSRDHVLKPEGKGAPVQLSSDPAFRGDPSRYNPEELLLSSISSCHMLWFLHLCSQNGVTVIEYSDEPVGVMEEDADGSGRFTSVTLHPNVVVADQEQVQAVDALHARANEMCFIANSCNFKIDHAPQTSWGA